MGGDSREVLADVVDQVIAQTVKIAGLPEIPRVEPRFSNRR
jgi:hypothetical protein